MYSSFSQSHIKKPLCPRTPCNIALTPAVFLKKISGEVKSNRISIFLGKFQERVEKESCLWEFKKKNLLPGTTTTCWSAHGCTWPKRYHYSDRTGMKIKVARINSVFLHFSSIQSLWWGKLGRQGTICWLKKELSMVHSILNIF